MIRTARLKLRPLPSAAARALPFDRQAASDIVGAELSEYWPASDLLDVLPLQAAAPPGAEEFGVWVVIERSSRTVVGDAGFKGRPGVDGTVEIGYSVVPDRRGRGYATEAVRALAEWALAVGVRAVLAECAADNAPSIRVLERVGFQLVAAEADVLRWRLEP